VAASFGISMFPASLPPKASEQEDADQRFAMDTHSDQLPQQAQLLGNLAGALAAHSGRLQAPCGSRPSSNTVPGRKAAFNDRRDLQNRNGR
jgi:hypothetical protein